MSIWWAIVFLAVFLIGLTKSGFGSGVGLMIVPMMAIALGHIPGEGSQAALGLMLPLLLAGDFIALWQYRKLFFAPPAAPPPQNDAPMLPDIEVGGVELAVLEYHAPPAHAVARDVIRRLLPGTVVGLVIGGVMLWALHRQAELVDALIRIEIGIESVLMVALHWYRLSSGSRDHLLPEPIRSVLTGAFVAVSSTLAHAAGPIVAIYLLPLGLERQLYVGTCAVYFFMLNSCKIPAYWLTGQFGYARVSFTLRFLPLVLLGAIFGRWINRRLSDVLFTQIIYVVTFILGWYILADGILRLFGHSIA